MDKCPKCQTENKELHWREIKLNGKDTWVCAYCYNPTITDKQRERMRKYE